MSEDKLEQNPAAGNIKTIKTINAKMAEPIGLKEKPLLKA